jgi:hypothetical protein
VLRGVMCRCRAALTGADARESEFDGPALTTLGSNVAKAGSAGGGEFDAAVAPVVLAMLRSKGANE